MPRFYFHTRRGEDMHRDPDGTELETVEQARLEAVQMLSDMAREEFPNDGDHQRIGVDVHDASGTCVARAAISFDLDRMDSPDRRSADGASADR